MAAVEAMTDDAIEHLRACCTYVLLMRLGAMDRYSRDQLTQADDVVRVLLRYETDQGVRDALTDSINDIAQERRRRQLAAGVRRAAQGATHGS